MRSLRHPEAPSCLCDGDEATPCPRLTWYADLYKKDGSVKDRWNSQDPDTDGVSMVRKVLLAMSDGRCAWCERTLEPAWQVDHWLPKKEFPFVAYCWVNMLPSCPGCNRRKSELFPGFLRGVKIIDPVLRLQHAGAVLFVKEELYPTLPARLLDPSFDEPGEHLEFIAPALCWRGLSPHGEYTVRHLFSEKDDAQRWSKLSGVVRGLVGLRLPDPVFDAIISLNGQDTVIRTLVAYWRDLLGSQSSSQGGTIGA